jgi:hypothetical protein
MAHMHVFETICAAFHPESGGQKKPRLFSQGFLLIYLKSLAYFISRASTLLQ